MGIGGFFKGLGKIGAVAAAPFTGGASMTALPFLDAIGKGAGAASQSAAQNRGTQAELHMDLQDQLENQLLSREFNTRAAQEAARKQSVMGDLAANWSPAARPTGIPTISFGGPSARGQSAGSELFEQAMSRLRQPDIAQQTGMPAFKDLSKDPKFQKTQKSGFLEKLGGVAGFAAPIIGAFGNRGK